MSSNRCQRDNSATWVSNILTSVLPFIIALFFTIPSQAQVSCSRIFQNDSEIWSTQHFVGLERLSSQQKQVVNYFIELFWLRLSVPSASKIKIYVLDTNEKLTDLPEFRSLRGKSVGEVSTEHKAHKGDKFNSGMRLWDDLRGCASNGVCAVGVERFKDLVQGYRHSFFHEMGHAIDRLLLSQDERANLTLLYQAAKNRGLFLNNYSAINTKEYFAEGIEAYAGITKDPKLANSYFLGLTRENLKQKDPNLYDFIENLTSLP